MAERKPCPGSGHTAPPTGTPLRAIDLGPRASCPVCGRYVVLTLRNTIRRHNV